MEDMWLECGTSFRNIMLGAKHLKIKVIFTILNDFSFLSYAESSGQHTLPEGGYGVAGQ